MNFVDILKKGNSEDIRNAIEEEQFNYYATDCKTRRIDLGFSVPNYDILMKALECNDSGSPVLTETYGDELYQKMLAIYPTEIISAYFARLEEFGPRDEDAMHCFIIVTDDIEAEAKEIIDEYSRKSVIKERNDALKKSDCSDDWENR